MATHRNEMTITIAERSLILRPSFLELERLEGVLGVGLLEYLQTLGQSGGTSIKVGEVVRILHAGVRGGMKDAAPSIEELGDMIFDEGLTICIEHAANFLQGAVLRADQTENIKEAAAVGGK